jgi:microcystin-dependent protein
VFLLQQGSVFIVAGRLSGEPGAVPIGAITPFAGVVAPAGWMVCDGSAISRTTYAALYAMTGNGYGAGNGTTTFNIPDLRGRFPLASSGSHFQTTTGGAETTTLSAAQLAAHDHSSAGSHTHSSAGGHNHDTIGNHSHTTQTYTVDDRTKAASLFATLLPTPSGTTTTSSAGGHTHSTDGDHSHASGGTHTHTSVGSGSAVPTMPPYLTLQFILRVL